MEKVGTEYAAETIGAALPLLERTLTRSARDATLEHSLGISVVFTSFAPTVAALRVATALANQLNARISLLACHIVPYSLALEIAPMPYHFTEQRLRAIGREVQTEITAEILLCRDERITLTSVLPPRSLVAIGSKKRWWPTREQRLAAHLRRAGHQVLLVETEHS